MTGYNHALLGLGLILALLPTGVAAEVHDLAGCQRLAETKPAEALSQAQVWLDHGGGSAAQLCRAAALFHAGDFAGAGTGFEALARAGSTATERQQANLLNRAAWSWLRAGDRARAERLYGEALEHLPNDADLLIDRGLARAEAKRWREAIADFSAALKQDSRRTEAWLYRANAALAMDDLKSAGADLDQLLRLKPEDGEAQVLRGTVRALANDPEGARVDWRAVVKREPASTPGRTAAAKLRKLEQALAPEKHR
jgi:tetratricopeptide (TPR) repeat protein